MAKHYLAALFAVAVLAQSARGQAPTPPSAAFTWATAYKVVPGPGNITIVGHAAVAVAANGEMWVTVPDSVITHQSGGLARQRLERRRANGSLLMRRYLMGRSLIRVVRAAPRGRLYLLGHYEQSLTLDATTTLTTTDVNAHAFIACLDSAGIVVYARDLTAATGQPFAAAQTLLPAPNDHLYLSVDGYFGQPNTQIHELDAQGAVVRTINQTGGMSATGLDLDSQGVLFVTGTCVRPTGGSFNGTFIVPGVSGNGYNQYVACYEPAGTLRWVRFMGDFTCAVPLVRHDGAGGVYWLTSLVGPATFGGVSIAGPTGGGNEEFLLARLNAAGTTLWAHDVVTPQQADAGMGYGQALDTDAAGNVYLVGQTRGTIQWAPGVQTTASAFRDLLVQRVSPAGVVEWARTATSTLGFIFGNTVAVAPDGSVFVTGTGTGVMDLDGLALPTVSRNHHFVARLTPTAMPTATAEAAPAGGWHLLPNPATARVTMEAPTGSGRVTAALFDALGRRVARTEAEAATGALTFDVGALPAGVYVVRATSAAGSWAGKLVKE